MNAVSLADIICQAPAYQIAPDATVRSACLVMSAADIGAIPVVEGGILLGILTERDVLRRCILTGRMTEATLVEEVMTRDPRVARPDCSPAEALAIMLEGGFRHLPVCDAGRVLGVVSIRELPAAVRLKAAGVRYRACLSAGA